MRRGYGRKNGKQAMQNKSYSFTHIGCNSGGLNLKRESLFYAINDLKPALITIQETKFSNYGTLKLSGYEIFECLRDEMGGGGL